MSDNSYLEEAYKELRERLVYFGRHYKIGYGDFEDSLHDGYLRLAEKQAMGVTEAKGRLFVTVRNLILDRLRSAKVSRGVGLDEAENIADSNSFHPLDNDSNILRQMKCLLTKQQFEIMMLRAVENLDYPEIASRMNMTEGAVRTNVSRARKILKDKLK